MRIRRRLGERVRQHRDCRLVVPSEHGGSAFCVVRFRLRRLHVHRHPLSRNTVLGTDLTRLTRLDAHRRLAFSLDDDEFATVTQGAVGGLIGSVLLVTLWLLIAVRSWRLIVPIVLTLSK